MLYSRYNNKGGCFKMKETYNGWSNRETWLVNLYFGDAFEEYIREEIEENENKWDAYNIGKAYEEFVLSSIEEELENLSPFLSDFIDLSKIEWYELGENVLIG